MPWDSNGTTSLKAAAALAFARDNQREMVGTTPENLSQTGGTERGVSGTLNSFSNEESFEERAALIEIGADVPREWAEGFSSLCTMNKPQEISGAGWAQIVNDAGTFIDGWAEQAAALGWDTLETFGINKVVPDARFDGRGLVVALNGRKIIALTKDAATVSATRGGTLSIQRRVKCREGEQILMWELQESQTDRQV